MNDVLENLALGRLQVLIGWVGFLVTIGAAAMAASYIRRSRWAAAVAAGFALMAVNHAVAQLLMPSIVRRSAPNVATQVSRMVFGTSVLGFIALATLVLGVVGVLSELSRAKRIREP